MQALFQGKDASTHQAGSDRHEAVLLQWIVDGSKAVDEIAKNAKPLKEHGVRGKAKRGAVSTSNDSPTIRGSTNAKYLTSRIARDHPVIHERMKAGEFKSVRQAPRRARFDSPGRLFVCYFFWIFLRAV